MTIMLHINPEIEKVLTVRAQEHGVSLTDYLYEIVIREARLPTTMKTAGKDKASAFEYWAKSHRYTPPLSDEAVSRASLVREAL